MVVCGHIDSSEHASIRRITKRHKSLNRAHFWSIHLCNCSAPTVHLVNQIPCNEGVTLSILCLILCAGGESYRINCITPQGPATTGMTLAYSVLRQGSFFRRPKKVTIFRGHRPIYESRQACAHDDPSDRLHHSQFSVPPC